MELRALEIAFALLRPRGFWRRVRVLFMLVFGALVFWVRAVRSADAARDSREEHRRQHAAAVAQLRASWRARSRERARQVREHQGW